MWRADMAIGYECVLLIFFFFQAEDGIRDDLVTGVQTCALPISRGPAGRDSAAWRAHREGHPSRKRPGSGTPQGSARSAPPGGDRCAPGRARLAPAGG